MQARNEQQLKLLILRVGVVSVFLQSWIFLPRKHSVVKHAQSAIRFRFIKAAQQLTAFIDGLFSTPYVFGASGASFLLPFLRKCF